MMLGTACKSKTAANSATATENLPQNETIAETAADAVSETIADLGSTSTDASILASTPLVTLDDSLSTVTTVGTELPTITSTSDIATTSVIATSDDSILPAINGDSSVITTTDADTSVITTTAFTANTQDFIDNDAFVMPTAPLMTTNFNYDVIRNVMQRFDRDQSGTISATEFQTVLPALNSQNIQTLVSRLDTNNSSTIDANEIAVVMSKFKGRVGNHYQAIKTNRWRMNYDPNMYDGESVSRFSRSRHHMRKMYNDKNRRARIYKKMRMMKLMKELCSDENQFASTTQSTRVRRVCAEHKKMDMRGQQNYQRFKEYGQKHMLPMMRQNQQRLNQANRSRYYRLPFSKLPSSLEFGIEVSE